MAIGRAELQTRQDCFDVIIGDLADPIEGGPCYQLYTKSFYESTVKPRLNEGGVFVTQVFTRPCAYTHMIYWDNMSLDFNPNPLLVRI